MYKIKYNLCIMYTENLENKSMEQVTRKAYAKINLGLDVIGRRPDGYHEVKMIMQTVGIYDVLTFQRQKAADCSPRIQISIEQEGTPREKLPTDQGNLIYRAAALVMETCGIEEGVEITLRKNIPIAAGMAGGSTDAAAVFHGLNELFGLSMSPEEMKRLGVRIGADVPYCIAGGTALSEGIGERLTPLPAPPEAYLLIAKPDISVSTKYVYENLHADTLTWHPDIDGMAEALKAGNLLGITERMGNVLERVTEKEYPVIARLKEEMKTHGALNALMSGSGPTVFGVYTKKEAAKEGAAAIKELLLARDIFVTEFISPAPSA